MHGCSQARQISVNTKQLLLLHKNLIAENVEKTLVENVIFVFKLQNRIFWISRF